MSQLRALLDQALLTSFRISPPPETLTQSLAVRNFLARQIGNRGRIVNYRQEMCPVTKQRLDKLRVLIQDFGRKNHTPQVLMTQSIETSPAPELTALELELFNLQRQTRVPGSEQTLVLTTATRRPEDIQALKYVENEA
ncbi:hypothetical protein B9G98_04102 [Wickerhamiella sorbophila]|uniref:Uncharacterized protein n=1 Tax=Wickerhamiella sorbophila TaxID=45607 RepID=A0A2T0FNB2_9ASCO|nr:hypothetical protein B9G98_04102 [Wickerhamiella sorbophila]PRT56482.1 hypothetical protein B9G98_04102 [Wickerhamiella sorbophila]